MPSATPWNKSWAYPRKRQLRRLLQLTRIRRAARASVDPFLEFCLTDSQGQPLRQGQLHRELQQFLTQHSRALVELPRDHGKSLQLCGRILWELGRDPSLRVKLVCATDRLAADRTRFLREQIESNRRLRFIFPELEPAEPWSAEAFTIARPGRTIGPSVAAFGLGSGSTGTRADLLVCDDVVEVRSLQSAAERQRIERYFHNNLMNLLEPTGRFWGLCTPWHPSDLNAGLKKNPAFACFRRPVGPNLESIWPEKWPTEALAARRAEIGQASFARGYWLQPWLETESIIQEAWLTHYEEPLPRAEYLRYVLAVDPAVSAAARADATALVAIGQRPTGELDCLFVRAAQLNAPALFHELAELDRLLQPDAILFESNAAFLGLKDLLQQRTSFGSRVVPVVQSRSKASRVASLAVTIETQRFRLRGHGADTHPTQRPLREELLNFPHGARDDLLDAAAMACEYLLARPEPRIF